jgi:hypothetical protein
LSFGYEFLCNLIFLNFFIKSSESGIDDPHKSFEVTVILESFFEHF